MADHQPPEGWDPVGVTLAQIRAKIETRRRTNTPPYESEEPEPEPVCEICKGAGWLLDPECKAIPCQCLLEAREREREENYNLMVETTWRRHYRRFSLADFSAERPKVKAALEAGKGLFLFGPPGSYKTALAVAVVDSHEDRLWSACILTSDLLDHLRTAYGTPDLHIGSLLAAYTNAKVLLLDDFGKERPTPWALEMIYRIMNERWLNHDRCLTIITSNYDLGELERRLNRAEARAEGIPVQDAMIGSSICDRIAGMTRLLQMVRPSGRLAR